MTLTGGAGVGLGGRLFLVREQGEQLLGMFRDKGIFWNKCSVPLGGNTGERDPRKGLG